MPALCGVKVAERRDSTQHVRGVSMVGMLQACGVGPAVEGDGGKDAVGEVPSKAWVAFDELAQNAAAVVK